MRTLSSRSSHNIATDEAAEQLASIVKELKGNSSNPIAPQMAVPIDIPMAIPLWERERERERER